MPVSRLVSSALKQLIKSHLFPLDGTVLKPAATCVRSDATQNNIMAVYTHRQITLSLTDRRLFFFKEVAPVCFHFNFVFLPALTSTEVRSTRLDPFF